MVYTYHAWAMHVQPVSVLILVVMDGVHIRADEYDEYGKRLQS